MGYASTKSNSMKFQLLTTKHFYSFLLLMVMVSAITKGTAQNLIMNGNFESGNQDCQASKFQINTILDDWTTTSLLSIYHRQNCDPDDAAIPHSGNGHLGILGNAWITGFIDGSVAKGKLAAPLAANAAYYLEFYGKSTGFRQDDEFSSKICPFNPPHEMSIYLGTPTDNFEVEKEFDAGTSFLTAVDVINDFYPVSFPSPITIQPEPATWTKYATCFDAIGGETQIAIASPIRSFKDALPCEVIEEADFSNFNGERLHQIFAYEIDDIRLFKIPEALEGIEVTCQNQATSINLVDYLPTNFPPFETATFLWPDGSTEVERILNQGGIFDIEVILPCYTIPLTLTIIAEDCLQPFFIPTAFSPNGDGINDVFQPLLSPYLELESYQLTIYNRWGNQVFQTTQHKTHWDGQFNNQSLGEGVFFWSIRYQLVGFSKKKQLTGTVSIVK